MRTTLIALAGLIALAASGCSVSSTADSITLKSQTKFSEANVTRDATNAWAGEKIVVDITGPSGAISSGDIGIKVQYDASATKVSANARIVAFADKEDESSAQQSIVDVKGNYAITTAGGVTTVSCKPSGGHGSSGSGTNGCEYIIVTVPAGSTAQPVSVKALSNNGDITITGHGAITGATEANAQNGDIDCTVDANQGSSVAVKSANGDVTVRLPSNFAADKIDLVADDPIDPAVPDIVTTAFPDVQNGAGRGTAGTGATRIAAERDGIGKVTLASQ